MGKHNVKITILIVVLLLLITAIGLLITGYVHVGKQLYTAEAEAMKLEQELDELDKYLTDYVVVNAEQERVAEFQPEATASSRPPSSDRAQIAKLQEAYEKIEEMERKIAQLRREKQVKEEIIVKLEERLNELKLKTFEKSSGSMSGLLTQLQYLYQYVDTLESQTLIPKDNEVSSGNEAYLDEIKRLKNRIRGLTEQLNFITDLQAYNFEFVNIKNGYEYKRRYFKDGTLETFQVRFQIPGNPFAGFNTEMEELYMVVFNPDNTPSFNTKDGFSGRTKGNAPFMYSASASFVRGRRPAEITIDYHPEDHNWQIGVHKVQIRYKGKIIGESSFEVSE